MSKRRNLPLNLKFFQATLNFLSTCYYAYLSLKHLGIDRYEKNFATEKILLRIIIWLTRLSSLTYYVKDSPSPSKIERFVPLEINEDGTYKEIFKIHIFLYSRFSVQKTTLIVYVPIT